MRTWDEYCAKRITEKKIVPLTLDVRKAIGTFDFAHVDHMTAPLIVKDPAAAPALSKVLGLVVDEHRAPHHLAYVDQLRLVYSEAAGAADDVFAHHEHGEHLRHQRTRFFDFTGTTRRRNTHSKLSRTISTMA